MIRSERCGRKMLEKCCGSEVGSHEREIFHFAVEKKSVTDDEKSN